MLNRTIETRDLRKLKRLEINAQTMSREKFDRLTANIARDGCLTSVPLIWQCPEEGYPEGEELILSGNHRCDAAVAAEVYESECMVLTGSLDKARRIAIQLSHNSLVGESDAATLAVLYQDIDDLDWREYAGLDDRELDLLDKVQLDSLAEAQLDFHTVQLVFLPEEADAARRVFEELPGSVDETWLAAFSQYEPLLTALESAGSAHRVGNVATQLGIVLDVFERHLTDLQEGFLTPDGEPVNSTNHWVGWEAMTGHRKITPVDAATITQAINHAVKDPDDTEVTREQAWKLLSRLCADYLRAQGVLKG